jgi:hypothetical protein
MIWLLSKLSAWMNRPYDFGPELEELRKRQAEREREKSE